MSIQVREYEGSYLKIWTKQLDDGKFLCTGSLIRITFMPSDAEVLQEHYGFIPDCIVSYIVPGTTVEQVKMVV